MYTYMLIHKTSVQGVAVKSRSLSRFFPLPLPLSQHIHIYACVQHMFVSAIIYVFTHVHVHVYIYKYMCARFVYVCMCLYTYDYVYMCVFIYIYITLPWYIYIATPPSFPPPFLFLPGEKTLYPTPPPSNMPSTLTPHPLTPDLAIYLTATFRSKY